MENNYNVIRISSDDEMKTREDFFQLYKECPIPNDEILHHLGLFINRQSLSRLLFMHDLYKKIIDVHGVVMEFGVRWGQNLALFENFRGMYEPFNYNRKIIGFDTFEGFPSISSSDNTDNNVEKGGYSVSDNYDIYLKKILEYHEAESPIKQLKKFEVVKGDATRTLIKYLEEHPETIVALAYFDFDIYEPTKVCLELIKKHITKGTIIGFDQLNYNAFFGETLAFKEVFGLDKFRIQRSPISPLQSFIIVE